MPLEIRVLGPLEVERDHSRLNVGSHKQRALLGLLALHADEAVCVDRCLQALWGPDVPPATRRSLHTYVSNLRRLLDPTRRGLIIHDETGYRLTVPGWVTIDRVDFERWSASDIPAELEAALGLWRAEPTVGHDLDWLAATVDRWSKRRRQTVERLAALHLDAGQPARAVSLLEDLVDSSPLDEPLWDRFIRGLYAVGRQADALEAHARLRRALAEQLGIDPSPSLRVLEAQILRQDPRLDPFSPPRPSRPTVDRPSIAVLPFATFGDPSREFVARGLSEDLTSEMARSRELFVVAPNSTSPYQGRAVSLATLADELGVRYLVEGSVQWWGETARITARLVDGDTGRDLWNERYDRRIVDLFTVRDEVLADIVAHLSGYHGELMLAEKRRVAADTGARGPSGTE